MARVMVLGASGQLGRLLAHDLRAGHEVTALDRAGCDLSVPGRVSAAVAAHRPEIIVNAAAYTAVDRAETQRDLAMQVNGAAVAELGLAAKAIGTRVVHFSTDYVFSGDKPSPYVETDATAPVNFYGESKLAGERALAESGAAHVILRTSWVYAPEGGNFVHTMLRVGASSTRLTVVDDQYGAPTSADDLSQLTAALLDRWDGNASGIFHCTGAGETTWYHYAREIFALAGMTSLEVVPVTTANYPTPAKRPANSRLDCSLLKRHFGLTMPHWRDSLKATMNAIAAPVQG